MRHFQKIGIAALPLRLKPKATSSVGEIVFYVFFRFKKLDFLRFQLLHTFSRTTSELKKVLAGRACALPHGRC